MAGPMAGLCLCLVLLAINGACGARPDGESTRSTGGPGGRQGPGQSPEKPVSDEQAEGVGGITPLVEGAYASVSEPFFLVVRDAGTYARLRTLAGGLPEADDEFFRRRAVVAAFLGTRPTGGYGVAITRPAAADGGRLRIAEQAPPEGAMLTQALTSPYKVVSVALGETRALAVDAGEAWRAATRPFRVTGGEFTSSGGFAGRREQFGLAGEVRAARYGELITLLFDLKGVGAARERALETAATGAVDAGSRLRIERLDAGTLVDWPNGGLSAAGRLDGGRLTLAFGPLPVKISDAYSGTGSLEAEATAPPMPPKPRRKNRM